MNLLKKGLARLATLVRPQTSSSTASSSQQGLSSASLRVCVVANAMIPTVQLSIILPLQKQVEEGTCVIDFITEQQLKTLFGKHLRSKEAQDWTEERLRAFDPTYIVFCRYSGPNAGTVLSFARSNKIPSIYCLDDDLLNVPAELGEKKFAYHNHPLRLETVRTLIDQVNLVYCSNERLAKRLSNLPRKGVLLPAKIFCAVDVLKAPPIKPISKIGYMGFDHAHDFEIALPAIVKILTKYPSISFELFGKIPKPRILDQFGGRVVEVPPVESYDQFLIALSEREWDIGIAPLALTSFNQVKNINKWIEYTAVGVAVVASKGIIYDECCSDNCGILCEENDWFEALDALASSTQARIEMIIKAQERLRDNYSVQNLTDQLMHVLAESSASNKAAKA